MKNEDADGVTRPGELSSIDTKSMLVAASEVMVAITDEADSMVNRSIDEVLQLLRELVGLDVIFLSKFDGKNQVVRNVVTPADRPILTAGSFISYEDSWCRRMVEGKIPELIADVSKFPGKADLPALPHDISTFISTPVVMNDGSVYGTLCSFSFSPKENVRDNELTALRAVATMMASHIQRPIH